MKRKLKLYIACSLDAYIATSDGSVDWLHTLEDIGTDYGYQAFYDSIDTTLMGYSTFQEIRNFDVPFPYPDKTNYVFSRKPREGEGLPVKFVAEDAAAFVQQLKDQPGANIWLIGGGQLNTLLLNAGLLDEMIISVAPIVLGSGVPLFAHTADMQQMKLVSCTTFASGMIQMHYRLGREA